MKSSYLSVALLALASASVAFAAEIKTAVAFRAIDFDAATKAAASEGKLVLIDFYTTWCEPCKRLDAQTWTDASVGKLVDAKAIALKLDAEKEGKDLAKRYKIDAYPTILVLKSDGNEVDRHIGFIEPQPFTAEFNKFVALAASGRTGLEVARDQVVKNRRPRRRTANRRKRSRISISRAS